MIGRYSDMTYLEFKIDHAIHDEVSDEQHSQAQDGSKYDDWTILNTGKIRRLEQTDNPYQYKRRKRDNNGRKPTLGRQRSDFKAKRSPLPNKPGEAREQLRKSATSLTLYRNRDDEKKKILLQCMPEIFLRFR